MKTYLLNNKQFIIIGLIWLALGIYTGPLVYFIVPIMLLFMHKNERHMEILLGFFFVLTLSDSRLDSLSFAADLKNIYILVISLITLKEMKNLPDPMLIYRNFLLFFIVACLCIFFNPNIFLSFQKTLSYILMFLFVPNYFLIVYRKDGILLFKNIVYFTSIILGLGFIINFSNPEITNLIGRFRGLLGNPNGLGLYAFLFIVLFSTINDFYPNLFSKYEKLFLFALGFYSLIRCGARASLIAVLMFFFFKKFYKISPLLGFIIFIFSVIIYQMVSDNITGIILSLGLGEQLRVETLESGSGRSIAWRFAWQQIQENFYFGKGFSYTEYLFRKNYVYLSRLGHEGAAHNSYLTFWLDTGLIGLICYLFALITVFLKAAKRSKLAIPFLYTVLFSNYYESWLTASLNPFTIQFLFILSIIFLPFVEEITIMDNEKQSDLSF